ncbi:FGGY-family carbohydrate kinase [Clostridium sp. C8-1-8]|uniref:xylulokinase n=1 Tax=Clostridium sp. C8-1-8 TaxID=2698831 RepID=UPI00136D17A7|nr:FGGY-family carbohydrate kinase [Clostridium sp. C8-1-8]
MSITVNDIKNSIINGKTVLGIELGSTRIKAVLIGEDNSPIASGSHDWENSYINNIWTYSLDDIWTGIQDSYQKMAKDVEAQYGVTLETIGAIGFSAMMHGYMAFNKEGELLVPFRTWRNTITEQASEELTKLFNYHIPQRWSIAHLYQAILNGEDHVSDINFQTTLEGYVHWKLTGEKVIGVGEASGMFPIDIETKNYNSNMINQFNELVSSKNFDWKLQDILPKVLLAGESAGVLTEEGAKLLDVTGKLKAGIPLCPPEGDAGTGMVATNSIAKRTGNVSAGTSVFAMIVLEKDLSKPYEEIDLVTTPTGNLVAMVHCNNCTSDLNAWVGLFKEYSEAMGMEVNMDKLFATLYNKALEGDSDCGGLLAYNYFSGEHITNFEEGRPLFVRTPESKFNLANFIRVHLFTSLGALKTGLDLLLKEEGVKVDEMLGHGGLFKTKGVGQKIMAAAIDAPVSVMETAGEGGAWGIALLASYMLNKTENETLEHYLDEKVFGGKVSTKMNPDPKDVKGFDEFMNRYTNGLAIERAAVNNLK